MFITFDFQTIAQLKYEDIQATLSLSYITFIIVNRLFTNVKIIILIHRYNDLRRAVIFYFLFIFIYFAMICLSLYTCLDNYLRRTIVTIHLVTTSQNNFYVLMPVRLFLY